MTQIDLKRDIAPSLSDLASLLILSLLEVQLYSRPSAIRLPTLARTVSIRGIPIIPNIRQNSRPPERMFSPVSLYKDLYQKFPWQSFHSLRGSR